MQKLTIENSFVNEHFGKQSIVLDLEVGNTVNPVTKLAACICKDEMLDEDLLLVGSIERENGGVGFQAFVYVYMKFTNAFAPKEIRASMPLDSIEEAEKARHTLMNDLFKRYTAISSEGEFSVRQN